MSKYLFVGNHRMEFVDSGHYARRIKFTEGEFYMDVACIRRKTTDIPLTYKFSDCYELISEGDRPQLAAMITDWKANALVLYRGFPGCHFCWPHLLAGELRSEGNDDYPTFTMGGSTRWLPTADLATAQGVSLQCTDVYTRALSMNEPVPLGFTVAIPLGNGRGKPLCWLNAGEIVVQGTLILGEYTMHSITWYDVQMHDFRPYPHGMGGMILPPQRPYLPASMEVIRDWWERSQAWVDTVAIFDATLQQAQGRRAQAATIRELGAIEI